MAKKTQKQKESPARSGLAPDALQRLTDPQSLGFETTDELPRLTEVIGQPRAFKALALGSEVAGQGFNTFVIGSPGSGRTTLTHDYLVRRAGEGSPADDWVYVNNFENAHCPIALCLPPGKANVLRKDVESLIRQCQRSIQNAFESKEYRQEKERLDDALTDNQEAIITQLEGEVTKQNFTLGRTPYGFVLVPAVEGKPISQEDMRKLSDEQREKLGKLQKKLETRVNRVLENLRELAKNTQQELQQLEERMVLFSVEYLVREMKEGYKNLPDVVSYLQHIQEDIVTHSDQFRGSEGKGSDPDWMRRYEVNVFVDNSEADSAPVIIENQPSYHNLLGRIEHEIIMGATRTDFTLLRPGALHRANGGYLIIPARDVLMSPYAWEGLERALREGGIRIVELGSQLSLLSTATLEPDSIPLQVKVVLIGTPTLYYLLRAHDEDFTKLFKVRAEFATIMDRTPENERDYALFVRSVVDDNQLQPFDASGVARVIEYGSRLAGDRDKLSTRFGMIADLIREAAYWARKDNKEPVNAAAVERAYQESIYRHNLIEEHIQELIAQGTIRVDVDGEMPGQVNGLSVMIMGDYEFGRPNRITASAYPGRGAVIDIERQADLSGSIHTKGILIISNLLRSRYAQAKPLSLAVSLTFEQSYSTVEGDSASAGEFYALLSAIAGIPLRQDLAVTGSVDQQGRIQAIGGVNEKIEGFFTACQARGLTGDQGVIIPETNVRNLMLNKVVVDAVVKGRFHIYPITAVDEGLELMSGIPVGVQDDEGNYPEGTFNHAVMNRLETFDKVMNGGPKEKEVEPGEPQEAADPTKPEDDQEKVEPETGAEKQEESEEKS